MPGTWGGDVISEGLADLPSSHIRPAGIYIPRTHSPCIPCLDFVQMVSSTWEGLCHQPPPAVEFPLTWDGDTHHLPGRPSLIISCRSTFLALELPKHFACPSVRCWPSLPCRRLGVSGRLTTAICPCRIHPGVGSLNG